MWSFLLAAFATAAVDVPLDDANQFEQVLISATQNIQTTAWRIGNSVTPDCHTIWSIELETLHGGRQEGVQLLHVKNGGGLHIVVVPTRGMGILWVASPDGPSQGPPKWTNVRLGWDSPVKEVVHPHFINLQSRGGLGWLEGFNEFMCRCGLESNGHPGADKFINNVGDEASMDLTLHGKIANIPASKLSVRVEKKSPYRMEIRGVVQEKMFYGPKLRLETVLSTSVGSKSFSIHDNVINEGAHPQEFELLYHTNFGAPLLGNGAHFLAPVERVTPFNAHAAKGVDGYEKYTGPKPGFIEQVYCLQLYGDAKKQTQVALVDATGAKGASMRFSVEQLPHFTLWKNLAAMQEGYVTGLEPGTNYPYNRRIERANGRVPKIAPGKWRQFQLDVDVLDTIGEVEKAKAAIAAIQNGRPTTKDDAPPKVD